MKIFYRLSTSIEHSGPKVHFNTLIPDDFDKMAEVFAGIIRHYTRGWADVKVIAGRGEASLQNGRLDVSIPEKLDYIWVRCTHLIEQ